MDTKVKNVLDKILEAFESGNVPEAIAVSFLPRLNSPSNNWSLSNRLIMVFSGTHDARGYRQWQKAGRHVRKGAKAVYILGPKQIKKKDENTGEKEILTVGFTPVAVFKLEDTEGEPLESPEYTPTQMPPLMDVAKKWGIDVRWTGYQGDGAGYFVPKTNEIVLCTHDEATFFHELAHAAHEKVLGKLKLKQDWRQEIVAELTSAVLANLYGKRANDGGAYRYIRRYAEEAKMDAHRACLAVIGDVEKCLGLVMEDQDQEEMVIAA